MPDSSVPGPITQLFPEYISGLTLQGIYLAHDVRSLTPETERPYFYANFISSVDGRIAISDGEGAGLSVPKQMVNFRDWRLFQELAVQADLVLSSGRYLRDYADGTAQEILQVYDDPQFEDLKQWRSAHDLPPYPTLGVLSTSLDFTLPPALLKSERRIVVITTEDADVTQKEKLQQGSVEILECGTNVVDGRRMAAGLSELGFQTIYSAAGPRVLHLLLEARILDRLYFTLAFHLLGGDPFSTIVRGGLLEPPRDLELHSLYLDQHAAGPQGQLFAAFDCKSSSH